MGTKQKFIYSTTKSSVNRLKITILLLKLTASFISRVQHVYSYLFRPQSILFTSVPCSCASLATYLIVEIIVDVKAKQKRKRKRKEKHKHFYLHTHIKIIWIVHTYTIFTSLWAQAECIYCTILLFFFFFVSPSKLNAITRPLFSHSHFGVHIYYYSPSFCS